jgi:hypothetical protein
MLSRRVVQIGWTVLLLVVVAVTVDAQIGSLLKKRIPKPPSLPGAPAPARPPERAPYGSGINDELIDKYIKAMAVQKQVLAKEMAGARAKQAEAKAKKAKADTLAQKRAESMMATMMQTEECKDGFKEKDPRSKEIARLEDQVAAADGRGDEARSEELRKKLDPLNNALDVDADRACGGKGTAAFDDCLAKKKAELAKQGLTEPMLAIQAQAACMEDPATSGFAGATAASGEEQAANAEEEAANQAAQDAMQNGKADADKAGMDAAGLTADQFAMLDHCIRNRVNGGPGCAPDSNAAIDKRAGDLKKAVS